MGMDGLRKGHVWPGLVGRGYIYVYVHDWPWVGEPPLLHRWGRPVEVMAINFGVILPPQTRVGGMG